MKSVALLVFASSLLALAHKEPKSREEIEFQRSLQVAAYHCAPAVAEFTAARKRAWAQKVLATPTLPTYNELFLEGTFADYAPGGIRDQALRESNEKLLSCAPVQETRIENNTCVLAPETTEGPYYHVAGHSIRQNIAEYQNGLLLLLDIGVIDVETCKPLPDVLVDIWQANATGHYAGHPWPFPHLKDEKPQVGGKRSGLLSAFPRSIHEETWLRGAWPTDRNGVAQFTTIFPGYYTGRATHIHTKVFPKWEPLSNGSFIPGNLAHVGQFFFEDDLNLEVDKMWPYSTNPIRDTYGRTRNWRDSLNIFEAAQGPEGKYDPVFKTHLLGGVIGQGVMAYITMGVNASADYPNFWKP